MQTRAVIRLGTFNAEAIWAPNSACLPRVLDSEATRIVACMDELLLPWHLVSGALVTLLPIEEEHLAWIRKLGLVVEHWALFTSIEEWNSAGAPDWETAVLQRWPQHASGTLSPYAITPAFTKLALEQGQPAWPEPSRVSKVNSKSWSAELNRLHQPAVFVRDVNCTADLKNYHHSSAGGGAYLLKEPYGVAGAGQFLVEDDQSWLRIYKHLEKREREGKPIQLIAEPYFDKERDFSCALEIRQDRSFQVHGLQELSNKRFRFIEVAPASSEFESSVFGKDYLAMIEPYVAAIAAEGYYGPVCIDSMVLKDGRIWPVVEINARESMGFFVRYLMSYLNKFGVFGSLTSINFTYSSPLPAYKLLLCELESKQLLWLPGSITGVLPLTSAGIYVNSACVGGQEQRLARGRWYLALVGKSSAARDSLRKLLLGCLVDKFAWNIL